MATINDFLAKLGYIPFGENDPFAPYRDPSAPIATSQSADGPDSVAMFKRPLRFRTPALPLVNPYDSDGGGNQPAFNVGAKGVQIVPQNIKRTGLILTNAGYATAYFSTAELVSRRDYPIQPLETVFITPSSGVNNAPTNALYAVGEQGADLRVLEIVLAPIGSEFNA
jgi:hypothetical protein